MIGIVGKDVWPIIMVSRNNEAQTASHDPFLLVNSKPLSVSTVQHKNVTILMLQISSYGVCVVLVALSFLFSKPFPPPVVTKTTFGAEGDTWWWSLCLEFSGPD